MAIAQQLAGYTLGGADMLRRAMGKKKKEELDKQFVTFECGHEEPTGSVLGGDHCPVGHPVAVRGLRVQQGPLGGLRCHLVLHGVLEGELPGRVHGGVADDERRTTRRRPRST